MANQNTLTSSKTPRSPQEEGQDLLELFQFFKKSEDRNALFDRKINYREQPIPKLLEILHRIDPESRGDGLDHVVHGLAQFLDISKTSAPRAYSGFYKEFVFFDNSPKFPAVAVALITPIVGLKRKNDTFLNSSPCAVENERDLQAFDEIKVRYGISQMCRSRMCTEPAKLGGTVIDAINWVRRKRGLSLLSDTIPTHYRREEYSFYLSSLHGYSSLCPKKPQDAPYHVNLLAWIKDGSEKIQRAYDAYREYKREHPHNEWIAGVSVERQKGYLVTKLP